MKQRGPFGSQLWRLKTQDRTTEGQFSIGCWLYSLAADIIMLTVCTRRTGHMIILKARETQRLKSLHSPLFLRMLTYSARSALIPSKRGRQRVACDLAHFHWDSCPLPHSERSYWRAIFQLRRPWGTVTPSSNHGRMVPGLAPQVLVSPALVVRFPSPSPVCLHPRFLLAIYYLSGAFCTLMIWPPALALPSRLNFNGTANTTLKSSFRLSLYIYI